MIDKEKLIKALEEELEYQKKHVLSKLNVKYIESIIRLINSQPDVEMEEMKLCKGEQNEI